MGNRVLVVLLRSVNVGGRTIKMDRLKALFGSMGFGAVSTYIQSGNVLCTANQDEPEDSIRGRIEAGLGEGTGFDVAAVLLTPSELDKIIAGNPWAGRDLEQNERVSATVFQQEPPREAAEGLLPDATSRDEFILAGRAAYILCKDGYGNTAYTNGFFEKKLKVKATTRNMDTMAALAKQARLIKQ